MNFRTRYFLFFSVLVLSGFFHLNAQTAKYSNEFLNLGVGARSYAMSGSVIASEGTVESAYWNPAALLEQKDSISVALMHADMYSGLASYDYGGVSKRLDENSVAAISLVRFGVDDIMNTTELIDNDGNVDYDRISLFSAADYALIGSYARRANIEGLTYGGNVKVIYRKVGPFANAWGFGFDVSAKYKKGKMSYGAVLRDATSTFNAWMFDDAEFERFEDLGQEPPENGLEVTLPKLLLGAARSFRLTEDLQLNTEVDVDIYFDGERNEIISSSFASIAPHAGAELDFRDLVYVRLGLGNFQEVENFEEKETTFQPTFGLGIHYQKFHIDYAYTEFGDQSLGLKSHLFTLRYAL
jgi:hypothetical protein